MKERIPRKLREHLLTRPSHNHQKTSLALEESILSDVVTYRQILSIADFKKVHLVVHGTQLD